MRLTKQTVVLDKYSLGKNSYENDNFVVEYGSPDKLTSRKMNATVFYLKNYLNWNLEDITNYFSPKIENWYQYIYATDNIRETVLKIKDIRIKQIKKEYNRRYNKVLFCNKEIDMIKSLDLNTGRLIFLILCVCKQYGYKHFTFTASWISSCYDNKISNKSVSDSIHNAFRLGFLEQYDDSTKISEKLLGVYDGNPVFEISNIGNISTLFDYVTNRFENKRYILCSNCGKVIEETKNRKYCKECAYDIQFEQKKEWDRKYRNPKRIVG